MKAVMAGQPIPLHQKAKSWIETYKHHRRAATGHVGNDISYHLELIGHLNRYVGVNVSSARILDLGCGQKAVQTALFHADGATVSGIDAEIATFSFGPRTFLRALASHGPERAFKSLARHILFDGAYTRDLFEKYGKPASYDGIDVRVMDATAMAFDDATFDLVSSKAVLEHINDVPAALREVNRVLKPGGIAIINAHLFSSLSGGHCLAWADPDRSPPQNVAPWDHLRENRHPPGVYLNRMKLPEYRAAFDAALCVVDEAVVLEGERHLLKDIEIELAAKGYTREDLLTREVRFIARKRQ
ncbi:Class I SAM-dependent methyltransferase [Rhodovastum atsumiense]|uniref:class I SAM-dependent methyltransferase n=1 Tax=Rhodovastum atsumiense TaxID=504468 RepID=UPI00139F2D15|nr:class I SAM-dependent methyltransferase [Rhodovastum atsumiense]CAH2602970.1 Class I SAM-dependent methyltransferase [Rhodovastum atsumiense]